MTLLTILLILLVAGLIALVIKKAPFVDEPYKAIALWVLLVVVVVIIVSGLTGIGGTILNTRVGR